MNNKTHWEEVYQTKPATGVSWFAPRLERSLELIHRHGPAAGGAVVDMGGGASTLVDDLTAENIWQVTVVDLAAAALDVAKTRLGPQANRVQWVVGDATQVALPPCHFDLWHDRAVFHFLTLPAAQEAYVAQVRRCLKPGGHIILATFGPAGPEKCSGLDIVRYNAETLHQTFGPRFTMAENLLEVHHTPSGKNQQFQICVLQWQG